MTKHRKAGPGPRVSPSPQPAGPADTPKESIGATWRSKCLAHGPRGRAPGPGLYIVSTPIGHAEDITLRALDTLEAADVILCEDTRVTGKLLALYGLQKPMLAYHDHNGARMRPRILQDLGEGRIVALVSDAGTPLVSDPGYRLVREATEAGHAVVPIPGASAVLAGLSVAGLPTDRFLFAGFLPVKAAARRQALSEVADVPATLVFFETGPRLGASLDAMAGVLGDRPAALARELTKTFEEVRRSSLPELAKALAEEPAPKGELVVLVGPPGEADRPNTEALAARLAEALQSHSLKDAVALVTAETGLPRRAVYQKALDLGGTGPGEDTEP